MFQTAPRHPAFWIVNVALLFCRHSHTDEQYMVPPREMCVKDACHDVRYCSIVHAARP